MTWHELRARGRRWRIRQADAAGVWLCSHHCPALAQLIWKVMGAM